MQSSVAFRLETTRAAGFRIRSVTPMDPRRLPPLTEAAFVEPVTLVATATVALLVSRIVDRWLGSREQGVQIDLRTVPASVSRLAGVPHGFMVVIDANGAATSHEAQGS